MSAASCEIKVTAGQFWLDSGLGSVPEPWGVIDAPAVLWAAEMKEGPPGPDREAPIL